MREKYEYDMNYDTSIVRRLVRRIIRISYEQYTKRLRKYDNRMRRIRLVSMDFMFMDFVESNWTWIISSPMIYEIKPKKGPIRIRVKAQTKKRNRGSNRWVNGWVITNGQPMG